MDWFRRWSVPLRLCHLLDSVSPNICLWELGGIAVRNTVAVATTDMYFTLHISGLRVEGAGCGLREVDFLKTRLLGLLCVQPDPRIWVMDLRSFFHFHRKMQLWCDVRAAVCCCLLCLPTAALGTSRSQVKWAHRQPCSPSQAGRGFTMSVAFWSIELKVGEEHVRSEFRSHHCI